MTAGDLEEACAKKIALIEKINPGWEDLAPPSTT
jgi:hypothetical protein